MKRSPDQGKGREGNLFWDGLEFYKPPYDVVP